MKRGDEIEAERLYAQLLPIITFIMQGLGPFLLYGKYIAALRLNIRPSELRIPSDRPTKAGLAWCNRFADAIGQLP